MAGLNWETLLCLGDSITIGSRSYLGYPEYCGEMLMRVMGKQWNVINHATAGFTTADLLRSAGREWQQYKAMFPGLVTVMIGTNDIKNHVPTARVRTAYEQLIVKCRLMSTGNQVVLLQVPPIGPSPLYPYTMDMNARVEELNEMIGGLAAAHGVRTHALQFDPEDFYDGVHLTDAGSEKAGRQLAGLILKDKGIEYPAAQQ